MKAQMSGADAKAEDGSAGGRCGGFDQGSEGVVQVPAL